jgi:Domain of unknown function (DUF4143)
VAARLRSHRRSGVRKKGRSVRLRRGRPGDRNTKPPSLPQAQGGSLEAFVLAEVRKQTGWNDEPVRLDHYRDRTGLEVDLVIGHADGRIAAIEVKATTSLNAVQLGLQTPRRPLRPRHRVLHRPPSSPARRPSHRPADRSTLALTLRSRGFHKVS